MVQYLGYEAISSTTCPLMADTCQLRRFSLDGTENPDSNGSGYDLIFKKLIEKILSLRNSKFSVIRASVLLPGV